MMYIYYGHITLFIYIILFNTNVEMFLTANSITGAHMMRPNMRIYLLYHIGYV